MSWGAVAIGGATLIGGMISGQQSADAQNKANKANAAMSREELAQQQAQFEDTALIGSEQAASKRAREDQINADIRARFDAMKKENVGRLDPYSQTGKQALSEQSALLGLQGAEAQKAAYAKMTESPGQAFLRERQERSLLRNSAAVGGLRGGNVLTALQKQAFGRAQTDIDNQVSRLQGLSSQGLQAGSTLAGIRGPNYVSTGVDTGVSATAGGLRAARTAAAKNKAAPPAGNRVGPQIITGQGPSLGSDAADYGFSDFGGFDFDGGGAAVGMGGVGFGA